MGTLLATSSVIFWERCPLVGHRVASRSHELVQLTVALCTVFLFNSDSSPCISTGKQSLVCCNSVACQFSCSLLFIFTVPGIFTVGHSSRLYTSRALGTVGGNTVPIILIMLVSGNFARRCLIFLVLILRGRSIVWRLTIFSCAETYPGIGLATV